MFCQSEALNKGSQFYDNLLKQYKAKQNTVNAKIVGVARNSKVKAYQNKFKKSPHLSKAQSQNSLKFSQTIRIDHTTTTSPQLNPQVKKTTPSVQSGIFQKLSLNELPSKPNLNHGRDSIILDPDLSFSDRKRSVNSDKQTSQKKNPDDFNFFNVQNISGGDARVIMSDNGSGEGAICLEDFVGLTIPQVIDDSASSEIEIVDEQDSGLPQSVSIY